MSPLGIASTLFSLFNTVNGDSASKATPATSSLNGSSESGDFSSSLAVRMASFQAQSVNTLLNSVSSSGKSINAFDALTGTSSTQNKTSDPLSFLGLSNSPLGLSASGRNLSLFDPESAYKMMSVINNKDVTYKAQFSEMSEMKTAVATMQQAGQTLAGNSTSTDNESIKAQLQTFATKYNDWINRFDPTVKSGGVLAGTQAAEISLYELEQSVENVFNGAKDGLHGLRDLGFTIDPNTNLASIDTAKLDGVLAANKTGAINTLHEFSANFAKSAELLNSANNFIPNRLANLDSVINYITDHKPELQTEFGLGDAAKPSSYVSKALASYYQMNRV